MAPIHIPPLRERDPEEVSRIARVLAEACLEMGKSDSRFTEGAEQLILRYSWPGNIRELRNVLSRTLLLHPDVEEIRPEHLPAELGQEVLPNTARSAGQLATLEELEREHISRVLQHHDGNRTRTADTLGISRAGLYKKLDRLELSRRDRCWIQVPEDFSAAPSGTARCRG